MILPLLLLAAAPQAGPPSSVAARFDRCVDLATTRPADGEADAGRWQLEGGGFLAGQCLGIAYANEQRWSAAAAAFEAAARLAERAHDGRVANYWAQAGNAWLAAGDAAKARAALDAALATGTLTGLDSGEAHLDRARVLVAAKDLDGARGDLDRALAEAPADPLAWLLSATLARRSGDLARAQKDITQALTLAGDDSAVQLEAGNIAAAGRDEAGARTAWNRAVTLHPESDAAREALTALRQFDAPSQQERPQQERAKQ